MGKYILDIQRLFKILLLCFCINHSTYSYTDLKAKWLIFDERGQNYVLATDESLATSRTVSLWLTRSEGSYKDLLLKIPSTVSWFIEDDLILRQETQSELRIDLDSLFETRNIKDSLFVSFYNPEKNWPDMQTVLLAKNENPVGGLESQVWASSKNEPVGRDFFIVSSIIVLLLMAVFRSYNQKEFSYYFNPVSLLDFRPKIDPDLEGSLFSKSAIFFLLILSLAVSIILFFVEGEVMVLPGFLRTESLYLSWIVSGGFILSILLAKLVVIRSMCSIFSIPKMSGLYMLEYIKLSALIYYPMGLVLFTNFFTELGLSLGVVFRLYLFLLLLRTVILYLKTKSTTSFTNLHLFSYLCTVDFIPMLIILNFFLKK